MFSEPSEAPRCGGPEQLASRDPSPRTSIAEREHARAMLLPNATGSSVGREDRAGRCRFAGHESESPACPVIAKEALAAAKDNGVDHQTELVDQIVCEKHLHEHGGHRVLSFLFADGRKKFLERVEPCVPEALIEAQPGVRGCRGIRIEVLRVTYHGDGSTIPAETFRSAPRGRDSATRSWCNPACGVVVARLSVGRSPSERDDLNAVNRSPRRRRCRGRRSSRPDLATSADGPSTRPSTARQHRQESTAACRGRRPVQSADRDRCVPARHRAREPDRRNRHSGFRRDGHTLKSPQPPTGSAT
jgi:hypothetical protein